MASLDRGVVDALLGLEHDVADLARALTAEAFVQDVDTALALDVGQGEIGPVAIAHGPSQHSEDDKSEDPRHDNPATSPVTRISEALQHEGFLPVCL